MNLTRRGSAYHTALGALILLIILSFLFGYLAYNSYDEIIAIREGDPEAVDRFRSPDFSLYTRRDELEAVEKEIDSYQERIEARKVKKYQLDVELASEGVVLNEDDQVIIGAEEEDFTAWERAATDVGHTRTRIQSIADNYQKRAERGQPDMKTLINDLRTRLNQVIQDSTRRDDEFEIKKNALLDRLDKLEAQQKANEEQYHNDFSVRATRKTQLDGKIRELLELRLEWLDELEPDGRVVRTGVDANFVIIDIGSRDRVTRGLKFEVFRYVRGRYLKKGMVEVIDVVPTQATCRIIEEVDRRLQPIAQNDYVGNPVFNRDRAMIFVLAGEFKLYNKDAITHFIERAGSEVWDELAPGVDFLIAGDRSEPAQDKAREYHVMAMTEPQLVQYLQRVFPKEAVSP